MNKHAYRITAHLLAALLLVCLTCGATEEDNKKSDSFTFRFVPGQDTFYAPWNSNGENLKKLYDVIDTYRERILSGEVPVYVNSYSASMREQTRNKTLAFVRANRVKSELIVHKGLKEEHFITKNYTTAYEGEKDVVVVTLRIPVRVEAPRPEPRPEPAPEPQPEIQPQEPEREPEPAITPARVVRQPDNYPFAIRTNLLYDIFLTPTLGVEWRVNPQLGIKVDGSYAHWGNQHGKVQKMWLVNPEVRFYMGGPRRFYLGASANIGEYNLHKYMLGGLFSGSDTGHQGNMYGGGATIGYQVPLNNRFSVDFNLGLGYTRLEYDTFVIYNDVRVYKERDLSKNFWGPTQAGINLVWKIK